MEANEPQANLYRAAEEYVSDQAYELMGFGDDDDFTKLAELMKQAVLYGAHWKEQQMMKNALKCVIAKDSQDFQSEGHTIKNGVLNMTDEELRTWWFERPSCYNCANKGKRVASNNNHCVCKIDNEIHNYNDRCKHHSKE